MTRDGISYVAQGGLLVDSISTALGTRVVSSTEYVTVVTEHRKYTYLLSTRHKCHTYMCMYTSCYHLLRYVRSLHVER